MRASQASTPRPVALDVVPDNIPNELKAHPRWVAWRFNFREDRWRKVPVSCHTRRDADITDGASWATFERAYEYYRKNRLHGVGFVFAPEDPFAGIDLDECHDPFSGKIEKWASHIIRDVNSYAEVSPSGMGIKIFLRGRTPVDGRRRKGRLEIYDRSRFFTVTGIHFAGTPTSVESRQHELDQLYRATFGEPHAVVPVELNHTGNAMLTDAQIIARAMRASNGQSFARLWTGNVDGYDSESEADLALANYLAFWVGPDPERIESLFDQSDRGHREKWQERPDYRERTIKRALEGRTDFYRPGAPLEGMLTRKLQEQTGQLSTRDDGPGAPLEGMLTRNIQEQTGQLSTRDGRRPPVSPTREVCEQVKRAAQDLAEEFGALPDWEVAFRLARRLRGCGQESQGVLERAAEAFCERAGRSKEDFLTALLIAWPKVRLAEGEDVFTWAAHRAEQEPVQLDFSPGPKYKFIASLAYHLTQITGKKPFWLPRERIAALLKTSPMTVSRTVQLLEQNRVIRCVNDAYSYKNHKAKEYVLVARRAEAVGSEPAA
jgi:hypothetical protein